ncbi:hypothetical protein N658DRAFT_137397 [Parathielavia hyrcaniae]|uniref:Uncharacterized protein n=1 Tax=Parathielavia hyrcaniae TaxID=113614 RepID=A0AAN6QBU7_9PEZI|nr:hypothetical protein N658DRAFT_137397 [Parathielavia hyrcaniae]
MKSLRFSTIGKVPSYGRYSLIDSNRFQPSVHLYLSILWLLVAVSWILQQCCATLQAALNPHNLALLSLLQQHVGCTQLSADSQLLHPCGGKVTSIHPASSTCAPL